MHKKIKTFEDACKLLKLDPTALPVVTGLPEKHQQAIIDHYKLVIIAQALNCGWEPNWNDYSEYKYFPYFEVNASKEQPAGIRFSYVDFDIWHSVTFCSSRLCFKSRDIAKYAGEQFTDLYKNYFLFST